MMDTFTARSNCKLDCSFQIPIVSHLLEMKTTLTATISAVCADIKTRSKARMEESRRLKVSSIFWIDNCFWCC